MYREAQNSSQKESKTSEVKKLCPYCKGNNTIKWGYVKDNKKQRYKCKSCNKLFVIDDGFVRMRKGKKLITSCIDSYFNGMSLRKIKNHINQFSEQNVSHMTIWRWIIKYSLICKDFTKGLDLTLSGVYHADEIFVSCKGQQHYFWDMIDKGTRYLVSTHYSTKRDSKSAKILFLKAKNRPLTIFSDGLQGYRKAFRKVYNTRYKAKQVQYVRLKADKDKRNNIVERIQGTIRERIKVMRGFKNKATAEIILEGFITWYNFIRIHQGIKMTPAEKAGVQLKLGQNKWLDLIYLSKGCLL